MLVFVAIFFFFGFNLAVFSLFQINAINAATEAACLVLSVDETVKNPKVKEINVVYFYIEVLLNKLY